MKHYDEHTIAQFLLNPDPQDSEQTSFHEHLQVCFSCREIHEELGTFYAALHEERKLLPGRRERSAHDLIRSWQVGKMPIAGPRTWKERSVRVLRYAQARPIMTSGIGVLSIALLLFALLPRTKITDTNPTHAITDDDARALEIYNRANQKLWEEHWSTQDRFKELELAGHLTLSTVADVNRDGRNEVLTVIPLGNSRTQQEWATLRVYASDSRLLLRQSLGHEAHYEGQTIESTYTAVMVAIGGIAPDGNPSIFIAIKNRHSPSVLMILDQNGRTLGEYWHYGHFESFHTMDLHRDGRQEIILCGINDETERAVVIVLDPSKIVGLTEATATPGFGYKPSTAEEYYIELPKAVFETDRLARGWASYVYAENTNGLSIAYGYGNNTSILDYVFSRDMVIQQINASDDARVRIQDYVAKGKARHTSLDSLLHSLSTSIQYWTGSRWTPTPIMVDHPTVNP